MKSPQRVSTTDSARFGTFSALEAQSSSPVIIGRRSSVNETPPEIQSGAVVLVVGIPRFHELIASQTALRRQRKKSS